MSDETTLLPCPFCGGKAHVVSDYSSERDETRWSLWHECCEHDGESAGYGHALFPWFETPWYKTETEAIAAWNTRAEHDTLTAEQVREAIERNFGKVAVLDDGKPVEWRDDWVCKVGINYKAIADELNAMLGGEINGDTSDGYHTFNELYHHRAVLFSVIVRDHRELAWKARKHHDGTMYDGMFIVGIETPSGQATYHYDLDPYWGMFDCEEQEFAPEWDGHTPDEAIARIAELGSGTCEPKWTLQGKTQTQEFWRCECGNCGYEFGVEDRQSRPWHVVVGSVDVPNFCPECGVKQKAVGR